MRIAFSTLLLAFVFTLPAHARCTAQIVSGPLKIRPYAELPAPHAGPLVCARNSYCSFQVVITAEREDCLGADVAIGDLRAGATSMPASNVTIYRQDFLNVFYRSSEQGDIGEWPDPLIPKIDPDYGERRNAFPFAISRGSRVYKMYPQRGGRALGATGSTGTVDVSGNYTGALPMRYVIQIVRGGKAGEATFRWYSQPGPVTRSRELATGSSVGLERGLAISFTGGGAEIDFGAGDEFWIFAGPRRHQPVWVDVLIPVDATPSVYSAEASVTFAGAPAITLPLQIEVVNYTLPGTPSLASTFGVYWPGVYAEHFTGERDEVRAQQLAEAYHLAALRNGITLGGTGDFLPLFTFRSDNTLERSDYSNFARAHARWLDGTDIPLGARATSLRIPSFTACPSRSAARPSPISSATPASADGATACSTTLPTSRVLQNTSPRYASARKCCSRLRRTYRA